jgi:hypothetical protein
LRSPDVKKHIVHGLWFWFQRIKLTTPLCEEEEERGTGRERERGRGREGKRSRERERDREREMVLKWSQPVSYKVDILVVLQFFLLRWNLSSIQKL